MIRKNDFFCNFLNSASRKSTPKLPSNHPAKHELRELEQGTWSYKRVKKRCVETVHMKGGVGVLGVAFLVAYLVFKNRLFEVKKKLRKNVLHQTHRP